MALYRSVKCHVRTGIVSFRQTSILNGAEVVTSLRLDKQLMIIERRKLKTASVPIISKRIPDASPENGFWSPRLGGARD